MASMDDAAKALVRYWRSCVADKTVGTGCFSRAAMSKLVELSETEIAAGRIGEERAEALFAGRPASIEQLSVRLWPVLAVRKVSHAAARGDGLPDVIAPIVTQAHLTRDGRLVARRSVVARDLLDPLPKGAVSIGTVERLDRFLTVSPLPASSGDGVSWSLYRDHCRRMLDEVADGWPRGDDDYLDTERGLLEVAEDASGIVRQILNLYDALIEQEPKTPLLANYAHGQARPPAKTRSGRGIFTAQLGHSNDRFPLAEHQRTVLHALSAAKPAEILAVNGPPGTGKTTMLLSAIAHLWVKAALEEAAPPLIVAASTNNQAVTNIIDAFGKDFSRGRGALAGRWLPDISSFGLFLPSATREADASKTYQTESFFRAVETTTYVNRARADYLAKAAQALPDLASRDVRTVVAALHEAIEIEVKHLEVVDNAWGRLSMVQVIADLSLGEDPDAVLIARREAQERSAEAHEACRRTLKAWERHLAEEPLFLSLFAFLPPVARRRVLKARLFLDDAGVGASENPNEGVDAIDARLRDGLAQAIKTLEEAEKLVRKAEAITSERTAARQAWAAMARALHLGPGYPKDAEACEKLLDCGIRFKLFLLATHYWEGRWLLDMREGLAEIEAGQNKTGRKTVEPRWRRRMMLTPCAVSTFATLPGKMTYASFDNGSYAQHHLFDFIDLLIVDEAGQVLPEVAGATFALAKQALVIGDTQQIEPISPLPRPVDLGNLLESGVLSTTDDEAAWEAIAALGVTSTGGSAMRVAQSACRHHPHPELERGLYLFEHRRCYDEIIGFCNALSYKGALHPRRGPADAASPLPPLGYLHIEGISQARGGSRANRLEAQTIAAWIDAHRPVIEGLYGQPLETLVGIVTPFGRQVGEIRQACRHRGLRVDGRDGMTVGTVHSLQGAERAIVIFSPVYSKHADGGFIDASRSMLNVAVSRAKDSFLVFGDMDLFSTARPGTPRAALAEFLFADPANALEFTALPREDLAGATSGIVALQDAREHDAFLLDVLAGEARKISIVSPWIIVRTMEQAGLLTALRAARERGTEIDVYVDPSLNDRRGIGDGQTDFERAEGELQRIGITLKRTRQLHSKIVVADDRLLCIGSFNWLSAARSGDYARHETSLVYRGDQLGPEIATVLGSLRKRQIAGERHDQVGGAEPVKS